MFHVPRLVLQIKTSSRSKKAPYLWIIAQLSAPDKIICLLRWQWSAIARKYIVCTAMYRNILLIPHVVRAWAQVMDPAHALEVLLRPSISALIEQRSPGCKWITDLPFCSYRYVYDLSPERGARSPSSSVELNRVDLCTLLIMNSLLRGKVGTVPGSDVIRVSWTQGLLFLCVSQAEKHTSYIRRYGTMQFSMFNWKKNADKYWLWCAVSPCSRFHSDWHHNPEIQK